MDFSIYLVAAKHVDVDHISYKINMLVYLVTSIDVSGNVNVLVKNVRWTIDCIA